MMNDQTTDTKTRSFLHRGQRSRRSWRAAVGCVLWGSLEQRWVRRLRRLLCDLLASPGGCRRRLFTPTCLV